MGTLLRVLIVNCSQDDSLMLIRELEQAGYDPLHERVESVEALRCALREKPWDVILSDDRLPQFDCLEALALLKETGLELPFIIISETISEEMVMAAIKAGAHDCIKNRRMRIIPTIEREIHQAVLRRERTQAVTDLHRHQEMTKRLVEEMSILAEIGRLIGSTLNIEEVYDRVAFEVKKLLVVDRLVVSLNRPQENLSCIAYVSGLDLPGRRVGECYPLEGTLNAMLIYTRRGMLIQSSNLEEMAVRHPSLIVIHVLGVRSMISVPLFSRDEVIGALHFLTTQEDAYTELDLRLAERIGEQIAGAIANAQLYADLKKTEASLRESEENFRTLYDEAPVGYTELDRDGRLVRVNRTGLTILGYNQDEMIGQPLQRFFLETKKPFREALAGKTLEGVTLECTFRRKDGTQFTGLLEARPIVGTEGGVAGIRATIQDITKRKQTEEALHRNQAIAQRLAEEMAVIAEIGRLIGSTLNIEEVYERFAAETKKLISFDRLVVNVNKPQEHEIRVAYASGLDVPGRGPGDSFPLTGTVNETLQRTRTGLLIPSATFKDEATKRYPSLRENYTLGLRSALSVPLISRDTVIGALHFRSKTPDAYTEQDLRLAERIGGQIAGAVANAQLYADLKKTEASLRESEWRYRSLFENMLEGFAYCRILLEDGKPCDLSYLDVNRAFEALTGLKDVAGRRATEVMPGIKESNPELFEICGRVVSTGTSERLEMYLEPLASWLSISVYRAEEMCFVIVFDNITERKRAEEARRRLEERLHRAETMEALGTLAGGVAHDLNNVLGVLVGYSELMLQKIPKESVLHSYASNILRSGEKGAAIIQDLLTLARRGVAVSEVVSLNGVISDYLRTPEFERLASHHPGVAFKNVLDKELLNIGGSSVHLGKTVMNLLSNAAESIKSQGVVTIATENRYLDRPIRGYDDVASGDYAVLTVSDTGEGISPGDLGKIFEPFYTKKVMGRSGTGLGLAVVWGTVKDHRGYVDVQSEEGKGSMFTLYFPVTREEAAGAPKSLPLESYMGHGESILVVDDVQEQRELAVSVLERLGYHAVAVSGGEEAVSFLKMRGSADLVVLDMIMEPGIDGLETYRRILEIRPDQKAILVSGFSETDRVKKAQELGAGAYVRKPYVQQKLGLAIRKELDRS